MIAKTTTRLHRRLLGALAALTLLGSCGMPYGNRSEYLANMTPYLNPPSRPVVVIPGFAASRLWDPKSDRYVWGTAASTVFTAYRDDIDLPFDPKADEVGRDELVPRGYAAGYTPWNVGAKLVKQLRTFGLYDATEGGQPNIYPFFWDWRLSYERNALELDRFIERLRREHHDPSMKVDVVGYSAGGVVLTTYLKLGTAPLDDPSRWDAGSREAAAKIGRVVLIATPQDGVTDVVRVLDRGERFVRRVLSPDILVNFLSLAEMLPGDGHLLVDESGRPVDADLWDASSWKKLGLSVFRPEVQQRLSAARREELERSFAHALYHGRTFNTAMRRPFPAGVPIDVIAGDCVPTTRRILRRDDGSLVFYREELRPQEAALASMMFEPGDGSVLLTSATGGDGAHALVVCDGHQQFAKDPSVPRAIIRSLQQPEAR